MYLLEIVFTVSDVIILQLLAIVIGVVIYFAISNRRKLNAMIEESKRSSWLPSGIRYSDPATEKKPEKKKFAFPVIPLRLPQFVWVTNWRTKTTILEGESLQTLRQSMTQQKKDLEKLIARLEAFEKGGEKAFAQNAATAMLLETRDAELQKTKQQLSASQKLASRVTEVYQEFDLLQQKLAELEEGASRANELAIELDEMQQAYAQLKKEAARRQQKLQEVVEESAQLHERLAETEDKLNEANLQRQQLHKKLQMLESMNAELQQVGEANHKLKAELRRIAELESLLSMVSDERDLLKKRGA